MTTPSLECRVHTFREGALSAVGHDLAIAAEPRSLSVNAAARTVEVTFDPRALRVLGALRGAVVDEGGLSAGDKATIEKAMVQEVLEANRHPEVRFVSRQVTPSAGGGFAVEGELTLHGVTRPLRFATRAEGPRQVAEIPLDQRDFGIRPYRALLGALKVKPVVTIHVALRLDDLSAP